MISKNLAASLKNQKMELADLSNRSNLNSTIIESLLEQALALEKTLQLHFDSSYGPVDHTNIGVRASKLNVSSQEYQPVGGGNATTN